MNNPTKWLLIDDLRNLNVDFIARSAEEGKKALQSDSWECVCLDHDLGETLSGYDVLVWAIENKLLPKRVQLVTSNPVGRSNMRRALENEGYSTSNGIDFYAPIQVCQTSNPLGIGARQD